MNGGEEKGWLNLSLRKNSCSKTRPTTSIKVYTCNFCKRKFYSSQALGGHQNAHRRERDAVRRYQFAVSQSLGVQAHSFVYKPTKGGEAAVARFTDGVVWMQHYAGEEPADLKCPGGFYLDPQPDSQPSDPHTLDLNLKL